MTLTPEELEQRRRCLEAHEATLDQQAEAREATLFAAAEKVTEWDGAVVVGDDYYDDIDLMRDSVESNGLTLPEYVWTCDLVPWVYVDKASVIDLIDPPDEWDGRLEGLTELTEALERFESANKHQVVYQPNYKRAFLVPAEWRTPTVEEDERAQEHP